MHDLRWEKCTCVYFLQPIFSESNQLLVAYRPFLQYLGEEGDTIRGIHTTPVLNYVDKINFTLADSSGTCQVQVRFYSARCKGEYILDKWHCLTAVTEGI